MRFRKDGEETRQRILKVASRLFAEKGYRNTTHEQICRLAKVNTAAINYHFRKKETLYAEAWQMAFSELLKKHPADGGVSPDAKPEERLHGMILSILRRITDPDNKIFEIINKEHANPTGILTETIGKTIMPIRTGIESIVRKILGGKASEQDVQLCRMSIMSQCFRRRRRIGGHDSVIDKMDIEEIAAHITHFSIDGINGVRKRLESGKSR
ncbi:MAG TPA: DUF1956 domain-containing protein [Lentisphaeria bacterium]|nr:MAG: hypothetical protein A2X48_22315 [Lentisphaerae bacterium GWF2_49_21]HBC89200.1 DUF1956 domain-containing protein [Lentisphaeria bacterium]